MNLEKAIELLQKDLDDPGSVDILDLNQAQELGIEASKLILRLRRGWLGSCLQELPGETKDNDNE